MNINSSSCVQVTCSNLFELMCGKTCIEFDCSWYMASIAFHMEMFEDKSSGNFVRVVNVICYY